MERNRFRAPAGKFIKAWGGPGEGFEWIEREHGIHIDHKVIAVVDRRTLDVRGEISVPGQRGDGHHIATDSKGNLYIAATANGMQRLLFKGLSAATRRTVRPTVRRVRRTQML